MKNPKTKFCFILLLIILVFSISKKVLSPIYFVSGSNFQVEIENGENLGFQNSLTQYVLLTVSSGLFNSSTNSLWITQDMGEFTFTALNNTTIEITYNVSAVRVNAVPILSGESITVTSGQTRIIQWYITLEPFLPVMFLFGMVGLGAMFVGLLYPAMLVKEKKYLEAFKMFVILFFVGLGLFMAWVFA